MRNGNYIRALGRQSFEPSLALSSSDNAPPGESLMEMSASEQSQEMQRRLAKAQNDVLASVGVCLRKKTQSMDKSSAIMHENEVGLIVGAVDMTVTYLASWPLVGIRNRLQTYRTYEGLRYRDVMRIAWNNHSIIQMFSGMPAHLCCQLVNVARDHLQAKLLLWLRNKWVFQNPETRKPRRLLLNTLDRFLSASAWILLYPLYQHCTLQSLQLLPPTPILPPLTSFVPFSTLSPFSLPDFSGAPFLSLSTAQTIIVSVTSSYFFLSFLHQSLCITLQSYFFLRLRRLLPRPDNPDPASLCGAIDDEELSIERWDAPLPALRPNQNDAIIEETPLPNGLERGPEQRSVEPIHFSTEITESPAPVDQPPTIPTSEADTLEIDVTRPPPPSSPPRANSPPPPLLTREQQEQQEREEAEEAEEANAPQHRVTQLSTHPSDIAASHLADGLTTASTLLLENAVMRTVTRNFLVRQGRGGDIGNVYEVRDFRANMGLVGRSLVGEWGLMWMLFEGSWGVCMLLGRRFGWGKG